jgi:magnesium-transporting ATPase (P-type)
MLGKDTSFEVMEIFKFNSDRKRMSIIVKDNGILKLYMKGADSIIEKFTAKDNKLKLNS